MSDSDHPTKIVLEALTIADEMVVSLHEKCCQPLRSPRMENLAETLDSARERIDQVEAHRSVATEVIEILEDAGSQLGNLQVGCCAPGRMELYATALEQLSKAQQTIKRTHSLEH